MTKHVSPQVWTLHYMFPWDVKYYLLQLKFWQILITLNMSHMLSEQILKVYSNRISYAFPFYFYLLSCMIHFEYSLQYIINMKHDNYISKQAKKKVASLFEKKPVLILGSWWMYCPGLVNVSLKRGNCRSKYQKRII